MQWLRDNVTILTALCALVVWSFGVTVVTSLAWRSVTDAITLSQNDIRDHRLELQSLHKDLSSVDGRFLSKDREDNDLRRGRDGELAEVNRRLSLIEWQLKWAGDRLSTGPVGGFPTH